MVPAYLSIPTKQTTTQQFFLFPQALKNFKKSPWGTEKFQKVPQAYYSCDLTKPKYHKTKH